VVFCFTAVVVAGPFSLKLDPSSPPVVVWLPHPSPALITRASPIVQILFITVLRVRVNPSTTSAGPFPGMLFFSLSNQDATRSKRDMVSSQMAPMIDADAGLAREVISG
jgi:hypothetical protein